MAKHVTEAKPKPEPKRAAQPEVKVRESVPPDDSSDTSNPPSYALRHKGAGDKT